MSQIATAAGESFACETLLGYINTHTYGSQVIGVIVKNKECTLIIGVRRQKDEIVHL